MSFIIAHLFAAAGRASPTINRGVRIVMPAGADNAFQTFGPPHVTAMVLIAAAAVALPVWVRRAGSARLTRRVRGAIALVLLGNELVFYAHGLATLAPAEFLRGCLPLHICGAAVFLVAWTLWKPTQYVYEIAYFWGLGGTVQAILTPNLLVDFPAYRFWQFFITHGALVAGVLLATWGLRMRPARGAVLRVVVTTNVYLVLVACADWALGANYMFLREPPAGASPFFFLPWPWYILFLEAVGLGMVLLLCLPFVLSDRLRFHGSTNPPRRGYTKATSLPRRQADYTD